MENKGFWWWFYFIIAILIAIALIIEFIWRGGTSTAYGYVFIGMGLLDLFCLWNLFKNPYF